MRREELNELCRAVEGGEARLVQHEKLFYIGQVKACHDDRLEVEAFGRPFEWVSGECLPVDERGERLGPPSNS